VHQDYLAVLPRNELSTSDGHHQRMSVAAILCFLETTPISERPKSHKKPVAKLLALSDDFSWDCSLAQMSRRGSFYRSAHKALQNRKTGAPRPMKMGATASLWRYEAAAL
jgi:hypothetical protein